MKKIWASFKIAFSMYSRIPMPKTEWNEENMKYSLCFFPLIGLIIGILEFLWISFAKSVLIGNVFTAAVCACIPVAVTGGIHADGYCDTADALSSYKEKKDRLAILKDPHCGAFAVIRYCSYMLLFFSVFTEIAAMPAKSVLSLCAVFILSRSMSGLTAVNFKSAKSGGTLYTFVSSSRRKAVTAVMIVYILSIYAIVFFLSIICGFSCIFSAFMILLYYNIMANKNFGGITGDLAGWFLQVSELVMLISGVLIYKVAVWF